MKYISQLETKDLILRKAKQEDLKSIFNNYWSSEKSSKYMLWVPQKNLQEAQERLNRTFEFQKNNFTFFVCDKKTGMAIGQAGMKKMKPGIYEDIGIGIGENFVGHGYGKQILNCFINYLFNELNAKKIVCSCHCENIASEKLQKSCGLKYAYSKMYIRQKDGMSYRADYYEITREEYLQNKK